MRLECLQQARHRPAAVVGASPQLAAVEGHVADPGHVLHGRAGGAVVLAGQLNLDRVAAQLALELLWGAPGDDRAAIDDRQMGRELVCLLEVVGRQQDGLAVLTGERRDLVPHRGADLGIEPGRRLVEKQHRWVVDQRHCDVEPALHPARVAARDPVGRIREPEPLQQLRHPPLEHPPAHPVDLTLET